jgi:hypothetical protein
MRRTAIRLAALMLAGAVVIAGCGTRHEPRAAGRSPVPVPCVRPTPEGRAKSFTITQKDNGTRYCMTVGTSVFVFLHGSLARKWAPITPSSGAVAARPSGMMSLTVGATGGFFLAMRPGMARLTSVRSPCRSAGSGCPPGTSFTVTVLVGRAPG